MKEYMASPDYMKKPLNGGPAILYHMQGIMYATHHDSRYVGPL
jgi:hypothetical protein